jgi:amidophosphoribosyltransferase
MAPCYYGIDMPKVKDLFAPNYVTGAEPTAVELQAMAKKIGADSLMYLPLDALSRSIGMPDHRLCRACLTGHYPTPEGQRRYVLELASSPVSDATSLHCGAGV